MRLWRIPGMPARCSAFLTRILKLHLRATAPFNDSAIFSTCWRLYVASQHSEDGLHATRQFACIITPDGSFR